jgi:hypothetical protein
VDPQSAGTVYLATDAGVYFTTQVSSCVNLPSTCWSVFGSGLPEAPVVALSASPATASANVLTAGTYGRGVWQIPLWTAGASLTTATVSPNPLTFPSQASETASSPQTVTLTNTGSAGLTTTAIVMTGDFSETDTCQNVTVAAGGNCAIQVSFAPTATGSRTGQMTISANVNGGELTVALSGTATAAGTVTLTPAAISFDPSPGQSSASPPVEVGTPSGEFQVEAGNSGGSPIPITSISITPPFTIASNACGTTSLAADTDCQLELVFTPTQEGAATGKLTMVDGTETQTVSLSGFGYAPPTDQLSPTSVSFPDTAVGQLSAAQTVSLSNTGDLPLTSITASVSAGFQISKNACGTQLAAHSPCTISVQFAPTQLGVQTGVLTVSDITRAQPQTVALSGTGIQNAVLSVNPTSLNFAVQNLNVASPPSVLTITNSGGVAAANVGFGITGAAASSFAGTNNCPAVLNSGSSCTIQVIFSPAEAGGSSATLIISSSTLGVKPVTVSLNGAGQAASGLNVSPALLNFAPTLAGSSSAEQTVTISNTSSGPASQFAISITAGFVLTQNTCTASLASNATCTVGVVFAPGSTGLVSGALNVSSASIGNTASVELSGTGAVAAAIQVTPANISFATTGVGQTSSPTTVTVTNSGTVANLNNLALTAPTGFQLVSNTCADTLGPGLSCTAGVEFAPTAAGAQTGNLTVTSSTVTTGASVPLQGTGFDFTLTVSGPSTQTVAGGQTANYTLVLTPLNSSSGSFTFTCASLPTDALCLFNPASETLNPGVSGNVTMGVSTGPSAAAVRFNGAGLWGVAPLVCGLLLLPLKWKRRRKVLQVTVLVALLAFLAGGVVSCTVSGGGGGGSVPGSGGPGATPAGTYSIPVTATSTGVTHSVTVTLTIE